jgi:hypothetical protein
VKKSGRKIARRKQGPNAKALKRIPPSAPSARDEGPRLLPLEDSSKEPSRLEHYLELADTALGLGRSPRTSS